MISISSSRSKESPYYMASCKEFPAGKVNVNTIKKHHPFEVSPVRSPYSKNALPSKKTQNGANNNHRRSVYFSSKVLVRKTLHLNDYTDQEYEDSYLTEFDYSVIEEMAGITQQLLELDEDEDEDAGICFRGIEEHLGEAVERRKRLITNLRNTVFSEQLHQTRRGLKDGSEYLAYVCRSHTVRSAQDAIARARKDQEYVFST